MKRCPKCGEEKSLDLFHNSSKTKTGKQGWCKPCSASGYKQWVADNPDKMPARMAASRAWYYSKPRETRREIERRSHLKRFGITPDEYDAMLAAQGLACAICAKPPNKISLAVDHDHTCCPGERSCGRCIRGLLCKACNFALGTYEKLIADQRFADYLKVST